ncbi:D-alanyl-D-alanine carboxypeptidase/D-alanyl-D-alanine-endopeptidase [Barrientosiimonas marina]|uniref:D-alanyl-D-alanine carboxypeptidase/D-alanyl-D-alanine-endopeptidase n=1 Tax=Lentibacillus kimchii TaxID=1542911 RepID=A0ABW2USW8_9BACI
MTTKRLSFGILILCVVVLGLESTTVRSTAELAEEGGKSTAMVQNLEHYINHEAKLKGTITGISIRDAVSGEKLYDHMGDIRLRPASNLKLLTAAAALSALGKDYKVSTQLLTDGSISGERLNGNLYLKGKGDPTLLAEDFAALAQKVKENGINVIDGDVAADDTWYDSKRLSHDLIWSDEQWYYGAQISALTASPDADYNAGSVTVDVHPGQSGEKPDVTVKPETSHVQVTNDAKTITAAGNETLTVEREHGGNTIHVKGMIPAGSEGVKEWIAVWDPTGYALDLFRQSLKNEGITWTGRITTGQAPEEAAVLYTDKSMPLSELLNPFMKLSNNTHAEMLVKELGKTVHDEGSWEEGLDVLTTEIAGLGVDTSSLMIRDGSGISHMNLLPANDITELLYNVQEKAWFKTYLNALPKAGASERLIGGTLQNRMTERTVRAKTGTIDGVSTLSGYMETIQGEKLIFSILLNNLLDEEDGPEIEDNIIDIIAHRN